MALGGSLLLNFVIEAWCVFCEEGFSLRIHSLLILLIVLFTIHNADDNQF